MKRRRHHDIVKYNETCEILELRDPVCVRTLVNLTQPFVLIGLCDWKRCECDDVFETEQILECIRNLRGEI